MNWKIINSQFFLYIYIKKQIIYIYYIHWAISLSFNFIYLFFTVTSAITGEERNDF